MHFRATPSNFAAQMFVLKGSLPVTLGNQSVFLIVYSWSFSKGGINKEMCDVQTVVNVKITAGIFCNNVNVSSKSKLVRLYIKKKI